MLTLIVLFTAAAGIQLVGWIVIGQARRRAGASSIPVPQEPDEPISLVIAARDGAGTLQDLYAGLRAQSFDNFEVVVVDDRSSDGTADLTRAFSHERAGVRLITNLGRGKKDAITTGVTAAANDVVALTDADCVPGPEWLREIGRRHMEENECIVVGYGPYRTRPGLLNRVIRYETLHTAILMSSAIALGQPYMAVGRSISYRKSTFERLRGLNQARELLSGDDDLFVQAAAAQGVPVRFMGDPATFVFSEAPATFRKWLRQKHRHLSTGRRYRAIPAAGLAIYHLSALLCWIAPIATGWIGLGCLLCRLVPGQIVVTRAASAMKEAGVAGPFALLDFLFHLHLVVAAPISWFRPPRQW